MTQSCLPVALLAESAWLTPHSQQVLGAPFATVCPSSLADCAGDERAGMAVLCFTIIMGSPVFFSSWGSVWH